MVKIKIRRTHVLLTFKNRQNFRQVSVVSKKEIEERYVKLKFLGLTFFLPFHFISLPLSIMVIPYFSLRFNFSPPLLTPEVLTERKFFAELFHDQQISKRRVAGTNNCDSVRTFPFSSTIEPLVFSCASGSWYNDYIPKPPLQLGATTWLGAGQWDSRNSDGCDFWKSFLKGGGCPSFPLPFFIVLLRRWIGSFLEPCE